MVRHSRPALAAALLVAVAAACGSDAAGDAAARGHPPSPLPDSTFVRLVGELSEPGGYFDTDNLISNERSYLHVVGAVEERGVSGGAYIGVGPSQNFSYIAAIRPRIAFIIDVRRDNLLQHLLYKALFHRAGSREEWLGLLFGREIPASRGPAEERGIRELVRLVDAAPRDTLREQAARRRIVETVRSFGIPLSDADARYVRAVHRRFAEAGLDLRFRSHGRLPRPYHPTYRQLLLETDLRGRHANFLHSEADFRYVEALQERNRVVPVVGDLSGDRALWAIGAEVARRGERVSALYTSNVEFYLFREGRFGRFLETAAGLPRDPGGVVIRSYFNRFRRPHPRTVPGYASTQLLQPLSALARAHGRGGYASYAELLADESLELR